MIKNIRRTLAVAAVSAGILLGGAGIASAAPAADPVNPLSERCTAQLIDSFGVGSNQFGQAVQNSAVACIDDRIEVRDVTNYLASKVPGGVWNLVQKSILG